MRTTIPSFIRCITTRRCWLPLGIFALIALMIALTPGVANAQTAPTTLFQLDGGAARNTSYPNCTYLVGGVPTSVPCDYWNLLNPAPSGGHANTSVFINGEASTEVFIGGGSKDPNLISSWSCTSKSSPDKDTLTNGYAAAYTAPTTNDLVTIFGADRFSTNGDANIGIWFFQQTVLCNTATGKFSGAHVDGDVFVVSAFTIGGTSSTITVYDWNHNCAAGVKTPTPSSSGGTPPNSCADTNLELVFSTNAGCDTTLGANSSTSPYSASGTVGSTLACATTNGNAGITGTNANWPWPSASSSVPSFIPAQALFTGGADITALLKKNICFSSFLEETRSSQQTSSVLKDFIGGNFNVCSISVSKACASSVRNANGTSFTDTWTGSVCNTSGGSLTNAQVIDTLPDGSVTNPTLSRTSLGPKGSGTDCGTYTVSANTTNLSATNTAGAKAFFGTLEIDPTLCTNGDGSTSTSPNCTAMATCTNSVTSQVSIQKHCAAPDITDLDCSGSSGTGCFVKVPWTAQVCNASAVTGGTAGQSQLTNIQVADTPQPGVNVSISDNSGFSLNPGDCTGNVVTTTTCSGVNPCPTGYTCNAGGFCVTPNNPSGTYKPTGFDSASTGNSNGRFLFDDTVSITSATPAIGKALTPPGGCPNSTDLACSAPASPCPLCPSTSTGTECGVVLPN